MKTRPFRSVFALGVVTILLAACGKQATAPPAAPPEVLVAEVTQKDVPIFGEAIATLDGSTNTQIHSQVTGYLIKQAYTEGAVVKQGDLLFEIDPRPFQADLDKANANLATAQANLLKSKQDMDRYTTLVKSGAVSQQEYQNEVQNYQAAQGNVDSAQASVATAQINLGYTKITAPIEGIAGKAQPGVGDLISPSTQLTTISTVDPIQADFTVSEQFYLDHADMIAKVSALPMDQRPEGMELILGDGTVYPKKGKLSYVNRQIQTSTGAIAVYALFPNPDRLLRPGQYAKVRGVTQNITGAVLIPQRAVTQLQGLNQVWVVKPDNTVEIRNITLGNQAGSYWIVTSGLQEGEKIVVEGIQKCQPGETVSPQPYGPDPGVAPAPATNSPPVTPTPPNP
jgi:membrane fusion protein (multidrug efflux system)